MEKIEINWKLFQINFFSWNQIFIVSVRDGEEFRVYFEDEDSLKELGEMRQTDPDRFYTILRKEELFLNTCLQTFGFHNYLVSLNPDKLFGEL